MEVKEFETKIIDVIQRTHNIKSFRFAVPEEINFKPGQFFVLTIKISGKEATKHFSFSISPTPRLIWLMVPYQAVDSVLEGLTPFLNLDGLRRLLNIMMKI